MKKAVLLTIISALFLLLLVGCQPAGNEEAPRGPFVIRNGTVITATGADPIPNGAVVVVDGVITDVGPESEVEVPAGAEVIDAAGGTILPGLIDMHTHVLNYLLIEDGELTRTSLEAYLRRTIRGGVTTLWDVGSSYGESEKLAEIRAALAVHGNTIPSVIVTGQILAHADGPFAAAFAKNTIGIRSVDEAREAAHGLVDAGVDHIKIALNMRPSYQPPVGEPPEEVAPSLSEEQIRAIVEVAHANGLRVTAHVNDPREVEITLLGGVDVLAHWPSSTQPMPGDLIDSLASAGVPVVGTFNLLQPVEGDLRSFLDAGGIILYGTDGPPTGGLEKTYREFNVMDVAGMSTMEMILSATAHAAAALDLGDELGTLEPGKQADIIIVGGDLLDDFSVIEDVNFVLKNGALVLRP